MWNKCQGYHGTFGIKANKNSNIVSNPLQLPWFPLLSTTVTIVMDITTIKLWELVLETYHS